MTPLAIALVLGSSVLHALRDMFTKQSADRQVFMWLFVLIGLPLTFPLFVYFLLQSGLNADVLPLVVFGSCFHGLYWYFLSRSYDHGDLSHVYPISRSAPALVLILAIAFLGERVSSQAVFGILVVVLGAYLINLKTATLSGILEPVRSIPREKATRYALLTMLMISAYSILDKHLVSLIHPIVYLFLLDLLVVLFFTPFILRTKGISAIATIWNTNRWSLMWNSIAGFAGYAFVLIAFTMAKVSYVVGLRQLSIVFAVLLGGHVLKESNKSLRLACSAVIFFGTFLIATAE